MKTVGIIRKLDDLGRITIPIELRRSLNLEKFTPMEMLADEKGIYIQKYEPECIICGSIENVQTVNGKKFCKTCLAKFTGE